MTLFLPKIFLPANQQPKKNFREKSHPQTAIFSKIISLWAIYRCLLCYKKKQIFLLLSIFRQKLLRKKWINSFMFMRLGFQKKSLFLCGERGFIWAKRGGFGRMGLDNIFNLCYALSLRWRLKKGDWNDEGLDKILIVCYDDLSKWKEWNSAFSEKIEKFEIKRKHIQKIFSSREERTLEKINIWGERLKNNKGEKARNFSDWRLVFLGQISFKYFETTKAVWKSFLVSMIIGNIPIPLFLINI